MHRAPPVLAKTSGLALVGLLPAVTACSSGDSADAPDDSFDARSNRGQAFVAEGNSDPNILTLAAGSEDHRTLVAAVQAAEMENSLVNAGPLTVFAPTDAAFEKLPEGTVDELLKPEKQALYDIVASHVVDEVFLVAAS